MNTFVNRLHKVLIPFVPLMIIVTACKKEGKNTAYKTDAVQNISYHPSLEVFITKEQLTHTALTLGHLHIKNTGGIPQKYLPKSALVMLGKQVFVLVKKQEDKTGYIFTRQKIVTGKTKDDWVEIMAPTITTDDEIILKGGTYLML